MARWRHMIFDAVSREPQCELPAVGAAMFGDVLDAPGTASVTLPLDPPAGSVLDAAMLAPPRAVYGVERNDVLVWGGPVLTHDYNLRDRTVTLNCEGWWNHVRRRFIYNTQTFTGVDQTDIARDLLDYMESWPGGDMQIDYSGWSTTGVHRDRKYPYYEHASIGTVVEQLATVDNGFSWRMIPAWTAGPNSAMAVQFHTHYPAVGRTTNIILDLDANAAVEQALLDSTNLSFVATVEGLGQGEDQHVAIVTNAALLAAYGVRLESVETRSDVSVAATLVAYANRRIKLGSAPILIPRVNVSTDLLDELVIGDQVTVRADMGLLQLDDTYRIIKIDATPDNERMTLDLAPMTAFV